MSVEDIHRLEQQYQSSPDDPEALLKLAQAYEQERLLGKALLAYAKALEFEWSRRHGLTFISASFPKHRSRCNES